MGVGIVSDRLRRRRQRGRARRGRSLSRPAGRGAVDRDPAARPSFAPTWSGRGFLRRPRHPEITFASTRSLRPTTADRVEGALTMRGASASRSRLGPYRRRSRTSTAGAAPPRSRGLDRPARLGHGLPGTAAARRRPASLGGRALVHLELVEDDGAAMRLLGISGSLRRDRTTRRCSGPRPLCSRRRQAGAGRAWRRPPVRRGPRRRAPSRRRRSAPGDRLCRRLLIATPEYNDRSPAARTCSTGPRARTRRTCCVAAPWR